MISSAFVVDGDYLSSIDAYEYHSEPEEEVSEEEVSEEQENNEVSEEENPVVLTGDYSQQLANIQNSLNVNTAALIGIILLIGLLMGLRKL